MMTLLRYRLAFLPLLGLVWAAAFGSAALLRPAAADRLFSEGHLVENANVVAYVLVLLYFLLRARASWSLRWHGALVIAFLTMRELDFHNRFTAESFMKISYYGRDADPLWVRVLAGLIFLAVLAVCIAFLGKLYRRRAALQARAAHAVTTLAAVVLLPLTKVVDSAPREIERQFGYDLSATARLWMKVLEESSELAVPLVMLLAIWQFDDWAKRSTP